MKRTAKAVICIVLCLSLTFSASAASVQGIDETFSSFFDEIVRFFSILIGDISDFFEGGYTRLDIDEYTESGFAVPGLDSGFVPQGLCYSEELGAFLISGYTDDGNSRIYAVNAQTNEAKEIILKGFTAHAGGISASGKDIWVASGGSAEKGGYLYHLSTDAIRNAERTAEIEFDSRTQVPVKGSFLGCSDGMIWVGEFYTDGGGYEVNPNHAYGKNHAWACGYKIGADSLELEAVISVPDEVQGMSVLSDGTVIFSTSYGRYNDSALQIYSPYTQWKSSTVKVNDKEIPFYGCDKNNRTAKLEMPSLMQAVEYKDGKLYVIYESGAQKYSNAKTVTTCAHIIDIDSVISKVK